MFKKYLLFLFIFPEIVHSYTLPAINLGLSSFLDGGPLRQVPGWYYQNLVQYYTTDRFLNNEGQLLVNPSPHFDYVANGFQAIYLSQKDFFGLGNVGFDLTLPVVLSAHIQKNSLGITKARAGCADLLFGVFAQALPKFRKDGSARYVHRFEMVVSLPTGKNNLPLTTINPGNGLVYINPYWAGTYYFSPRFCTSWRLHYLWCSTNHKTHIKPGDAVHLNFSLEHQVRPHFWLGMNGYFLQQIKDSTLAGIPILDARERVLGIGAGFLHSFERRYTFVIVGNLYFETLVKNRTQGIKAIFRILKHF